MDQCFFHPSVAATKINPLPPTDQSGLGMYIYTHNYSFCLCVYYVNSLTTQFCHMWHGNQSWVLLIIILLYRCYVMFTCVGHEVWVSSRECMWSALPHPLPKKLYIIIIAGNFCNLPSIITFTISNEGTEGADASVHVYYRMVIIIHRFGIIIFIEWVCWNAN